VCVHKGGEGDGGRERQGEREKGLLKKCEGAEGDGQRDGGVVVVLDVGALCMLV
jgi:hypothetical protein